ncbi:MAG TPA: GntR family transcriptional regulator [Candidatus Aminicenantes bacterium]|nr:GntR family transcriptional regulator [Candidatus Aminicenantes bacterium]
MPKKYSLGYRSLKDLVYDYLRGQMQKGELKTGDPINMDQTAKKLGISKTPLREALIKLETESFIKIIPWKGVLVNTITIQDFQDCYQVLGALESAALTAAAPRMKIQDITRMETLNQEMRVSLEEDDFDNYYLKNLEFHNVYLNLCKNHLLVEAVDILKKRLYEFSRPKEFIKEWEDISLTEHKKLVDHLNKGEIGEAADYLRHVIWSFEVQKKYIIRYYRFDSVTG